jgi:hypothetical protein
MISYRVQTAVRLALGWYRNRYPAYVPDPGARVSIMRTSAHWSAL